MRKKEEQIQQENNLKSNGMRIQQDLEKPEIKDVTQGSGTTNYSQINLGKEGSDKSEDFEEKGEYQRLKSIPKIKISAEDAESLLPEEPPLPMGRRRMLKKRSTKKRKSHMMIELPKGASQGNKSRKLGETPRKRVPKNKKTTEKREIEDQVEQQRMQNPPSSQTVNISRPKKKKKGKAGWIGALVGGGALAGTIGSASAKTPIVIISVINFLF